MSQRSLYSLFRGLLLRHAPKPHPAGPDAAWTGPAHEIPDSPAELRSVSVALRLRFGRSEQRFTSADGEVLLGRALSNHVILPLRGVSREHAKITWGEDGWPNLVNLSRKGTSVNDEASGEVSTCEQPQALLGSGVIALSASYREAAVAGDVVRFSVEVS
jgi:hypothetical protein